jgi:hypothetical protein
MNFRTLIAVGVVFTSSSAFAAITGTVFQDFNSNGKFDTADTTTTMASDRGIGGVTVTAYGTNNAVCGTATSNAVAPTAPANPALGAYTLTLTTPAPAGCAGPTYRVEFTGLPANFRPGAHSTDSSSAGVALNSGSSTQFVADGNSEVNLAINVPCDYCENNPTFISARHVGNGLDNLMAAFSFPYFSGIPGTTTPDNVSEFVPADANHGLRITADKIGAVWGSSYAKQKKTLFYAAFQKRHAAYAKLVAANGGPVPDANGENGSGRIYFQTRPAAAAGAPTVTTINLLVDLENLFPGSTKPAGNNHNASDWVSDTPALGDSAYKRVGRVGFGDVAVSKDEKTLYAVNLNDKKIYKVPLASPVALVTSGVTSVDLLGLANVPTTATGCPDNASLIPGAINVSRYNGKVYFGLTCVATGPGSTTPLLPAKNDPANLRAFIYEWDGAAASATQVANFPLNYVRQCVTLSNGNCANAAWLPWTDDITDAIPGAPFSASYRPQPWLMNIDFDSSGSMILGFADRFGHQTGNNFAPASTGTLSGLSAGDTLKLAASTSAAGTWDAPPAAEFYTGDNWGTGDGHQETTLGGLAYVPGADKVVSSAFDAVNQFNNNFRSGGVIWLNNSSGIKDRQYQVYGRDELGSFGKAAGIGDMELLCDPAPIEIGNRVWRDSNGNGIQDPDEPPIAGVTVSLYAPNGTTLLGTAVTDANGEYYFSSATGTSTGNAIYGITALTSNTTGYTLKIDVAADYSDPAKLSGLALSPSNAGGDVTNNSITDVRDSDAVVTSTTALPNASTNVPTITFNTGDAGENNHGLDFGFAPTYSLGNRVWFDANNNGLVDGAEAGVDGVLVELLAETTPGSGVYAATGTTLTTANGGFYRFDGLVPGNYKVRVNPSNFAAAGPLRGYFTSGTPTANANDDANNDNNGIAPTGGDYVGQGVSSGAVTVGGATPEPTNDNTEASATASYNATNSNGTAAPDARSNLSVDFGFHAVSIGNRVWLDTGTGAGQTNNGVFDAGEAPVADGTAVTLVDALGNVIATTTTVGGTYLFSTDTAGNPLLLSGSPADVAKQFRVVISPPAGLASSTPTSPVAAGNDEKDHGTPTAAGGNIQSPNFSFSNLGTTTNGQVPTAATAVTTQPQLDFGLVPTFSLGNRVWFDGNNNGLVDGAETGVDGVVVELLVETTPGSGVFVPTATPTTLTTANGGYYRFDGLGAGNYKVRVAASNFAATGPLRGYFTSGTPVANANGDANNDNNGIAPAGTGTDTYVQAGVSSGPITLGGATPEPTNDNTEASGAATYNATNSNGTAAPDAQSNLSVDFGFHKVVIGNQLWFDTGTGAGQTNNGVFDAGESPLPDGTVVNLVDAAGNIIATTTTTGGTGTYVFMTDTAGNPLLNSTADAATKQFRVVVPTPPAGAVSSTPTETTLTATGDGKDHGAPGAAGAVQTGLFNLTPGAASNGQTVSPATAVTRQLQLDMGFVPLYSLGNRVWLDTDNSGTINNGEQGKDGVVVNLLNGTGQALYRQTDGSLGTTVTATPITTTTAGGGYYRFDGLPPGQYTVQLAPVNFAPGGMLYSASTSAPLPVSTGPGANGNDGVDNNSNAIANPNPAANGIRSNVVTLGDGTGEPTGETDLSATGQGSSDNRADMTIDFGFVPVTFALGNAVFVDANNNGIKDPGEVGIGAGVTVELFADANGDGIPDGPAIKTTTTNGDGQYLFSGLPEGQYIVQISGAPLTGYASSTGINGSATGPYEPGSGDFTATGNDRDHGRTVSPGVIRSGTITLGANTPTGEGTDLTVTDPNATPDSRTNLTVDFGVFRPASIGTVVWIDNGSNGGVSGDGIKQPGEVGIPGVTVRLLDASGNPVDGDPATPGVQPVTTVTDANGAYSFTNLIPGQYQVEFVFPPGSTVTNTVNPPGSGSPAVGLDSQRNEMNPGTRRTPVITLTAGQDNPNLDSGVLAFSNVPKEIPTLNEWMLMLLSLLMIGVIALRVRPTRRG